MSDLLIFGGTTEGRALAEFCAENDIEAYVSTATEYGGDIIDKAKRLHILTGRLDSEQIAQLIRRGDIGLVIDATHPYAVRVTENIRRACERTLTRYYRLVREESAPVDSGRYFDSVSEAAAYLNGVSGNILVTTGSKELKEFAPLHDRCTVRVLPSEDITAECGTMGFSRIIAEQGPFSEEENISHITAAGAEYLVTKDGGRAGGFPEKVSAAEKCGAKLIIIKRPREQGISLERAKEMILAMSKRIAVVGTGMDGNRTMTAEGLEAVRSAELIIGAERVVSPFKDMGKEIFISYDPNEIAKHIAETEHEKIAVLMSGDCGFFSGAEKLLPKLAGYDVRVICGISSAAYFCGRIGVSQNGTELVSLHGRRGNIVRRVCAHERTFFLLGGDISPKGICRRLCEYGLGDAEIYVGENLSYENERLTYGKAEELTDIETDKLCVLMAINRRYERYLRGCIPDSEFIRGNVPMTKAEVRSIVVNKLCIPKDGTVWDIGCGTGSVSVEAALRCECGTVYAVDRSAEAAELTDKNRRKFGCDNINIVTADGGEAVKTLPKPDCVFIGGSGGELGDIISAAIEKNPAARIVITAVTLETLNESIRLLEAAGRECEISQTAITRVKKVGAHSMLSAENPVFVVNSE
ncbi:MAG: precorrin-6A reductase [Oscillospiraceae bacterium]|nr:precorrin-6A reductase [Oscillospiraceae bacterium]